jgi:hypothetical protein
MGEYMGISHNSFAVVMRLGARWEGTAPIILLWWVIKAWAFICFGLDLGKCNRQASAAKDNSGVIILHSSINIANRLTQKKRALRGLFHHVYVGPQLLLKCSGRCGCQGACYD